MEIDTTSTTGMMMNNAPESSTKDNVLNYQEANRKSVRLIMNCCILVTKITSLNSWTYRKELTALQKKAAAKRSELHKESEAMKAKEKEKEAKSKTEKDKDGGTEKKAAQSSTSTAEAAGATSGSTAGAAPPSGKEDAATAGTNSSKQVLSSSKVDNKAAAEQQNAELQSLVQQTNQLQQQYATFVNTYVSMRSYLGQVLDEMQKRKPEKHCTTYIGIVLSALENLTKPEFCYLLRNLPSNPGGRSSKHLNKSQGVAGASGGTAAASSSTGAQLGNGHLTTGAQQGGITTNTARSTPMNATNSSANSSPQNAPLSGADFAPAMALLDRADSVDQNSLGFSVQIDDNSANVDMSASMDRPSSAAHNMFGGNLDQDEYGDHDHDEHDEDLDDEEEEDDILEEEDEEEYYDDDGQPIDVVDEQYDGEEGMDDMGMDEEGEEFGPETDDDEEFMGEGEEFLNGLFNDLGDAHGTSGGSQQFAGDREVGTLTSHVFMGGGGSAQHPFVEVGPGGVPVVDSSGSRGHYPVAFDAAGNPIYHRTGGASGWHRSSKDHGSGAHDPFGNARKPGDQKEKQLISGALANILTGAPYSSELEEKCIHPYFGVCFEHTSILAEFYRARRRLARFLDLSMSSTDHGCVRRDNVFFPLPSWQSTVYVSSTSGPFCYNEQISELLTDGEDRFYFMSEGIPAQLPGNYVMHSYQPIQPPAILTAEELGLPADIYSLHPPERSNRTSAASAANPIPIYESRTNSRQLDRQGRLQHLGSVAVYNLIDEMVTDAPAQPEQTAISPGAESLMDRALDQAVEMGLGDSSSSATNNARPVRDNPNAGMTQTQRAALQAEVAVLERSAREAGLPELQAEVDRLRQAIDSVGAAADAAAARAEADAATAMEVEPAAAVLFRETVVIEGPPAAAFAPAPAPTAEAVAPAASASSAAVANSTDQQEDQPVAMEEDTPLLADPPVVPASSDAPVLAQEVSVSPQMEVEVVVPPADEASASAPDNAAAAPAAPQQAEPSAASVAAPAQEAEAETSVAAAAENNNDTSGDAVMEDATLVSVEGSSAPDIAAAAEPAGTSAENNGNVESASAVADAGTAGEAAAENAGSDAAAAAAAPAAAEPEEPDLDYALPPLRALVTCLNLTQRQILNVTSIDAEFLMALPEDMQGEQMAGAIEGIGGCSVLRNGVDDTARPLPAPDSAEVTGALPQLPPDLRREVRRMLERAAAGPGDEGGQGGQSAEIDNATFFATLDPETRQGILAEADDSILQSLPADLRAEAYVIRERRAQQMANEQARRERDRAQREQYAAQLRQQRDQQAAAMAGSAGLPPGTHVIRLDHGAGGGDIQRSLQNFISSLGVDPSRVGLRFDVQGVGGETASLDPHQMLQMFSSPGSFMELITGQRPSASGAAFGGPSAGGSSSRQASPGQLLGDSRNYLFQPTNSEVLESDVIRAILRRFQDELGVLGGGGPPSQLLQIPGPLPPIQSSSSSSSSSTGLVAPTTPQSAQLQQLSAFDEQHTLTLCKLIFTQRFLRIGSLVRQVLFHVSLHPTARSNVLAFFLQLLSGSSLVQFCIEDDSVCAQWSPRALRGGEEVEMNTTTTSVANKPIEGVDQIWKTGSSSGSSGSGSAPAAASSSSSGGSTALLIGQTQQASSSSSSSTAPAFAFQPPQRVSRTTAARGGAKQGEQATDPNERLLTRTVAQDLVKMYGSTTSSSTSSIQSLTNQQLDNLLLHSSRNVTRSQAGVILRGRALEGLRDIVLRVPHASAFFLQNDNVSKLILLTDVIGYENANHVNLVIETCESLLTFGGSESLASWHVMQAMDQYYNQAEEASKQLRKSLRPDATKSLVQYLCLAPYSPDHDGALRKTKNMLVRLMADEIESQSLQFPLPEELIEKPPVEKKEENQSGAAKTEGDAVEKANSPDKNASDGTAAAAASKANEEKPDVEMKPSEGEAAAAVGSSGSAAPSAAADPVPAPPQLTEQEKKQKEEAEKKQKEEEKKKEQEAKKKIEEAKKQARADLCQRISDNPTKKLQLLYQLLLVNTSRVIQRVSRSEEHAEGGPEALFLRLLKMLQELFVSERKEAERSINRKILAEKRKQEQNAAALAGAGGAAGTSSSSSSSKLLPVTGSSSASSSSKLPPPLDTSQSLLTGINQPISTPRKEEMKDKVATELLTAEEQEECTRAGIAKLQAFLDSAGVDELWNFLDRTLTKATEEAPGTTSKLPATSSATPSTAPTTPASGEIDLTKQMPLIEALFLFHCGEDANSSKQNKARDRTVSKDSAKEGEKEWLRVSTNDEENNEEDQVNPRIQKLKVFSERHSRAINHSVKQTPNLLQKSLAPIVKYCPYILDFNNKRTFFKQKIKQGRDSGHRYSTLRLNVRRSAVFLDTYHQLRLRTADEMKGKVAITFQGEEGMDAGGLTREWYVALAKDMFNPNYALFEQAAGKQSTFHPSALSGVNSEHLSFFRFVGRIIGKAVFDNANIPTFFTRSLYKQMLKRRVAPQDLEALDPEYYKQVQQIMHNDVTEMYLTFSTERQEFGQTKEYDLIPNGSKVDVTNENKHEYIQKMAEFKLLGAVKEQIASFLSGFHELLPPEIQIFDDKELELLIAGMPKIDLKDLRANTEYTNYTENSDQIKWFWEVMGDFTEEQKAQFLQFVTGTSQVPLDGFKALIGMRGPQKFSIHRAHTTERLPSAHTCFNQLDLPEYTNKQQLKTKLIQAVEMAYEGFGFI
ncbi:unnamed protein product [Amoebophrya sp. A120]|nr:unnamed protein product [Amoebophrya sp. A120]|eukprot:GSA120T00012791001.1